MKRFFNILTFSALTVVLMVLCLSAENTMTTVTDDAKAEYGSCTQHVYPNNGEYIVVNEATCKLNGVKYRVCAVCNAIDRVETPKNPDNHSDTESKEFTYLEKPTCTTGGTGYYLCRSCNKPMSYVDLPVDPEAHVKDGDFVVITPETCRNKGTMAHRCKYCSKYFNYQTIASDPDSHVITDASWKVDTMPTCAAEGCMNCYCQECGNVVKTKPIAATGEHTPGNGWAVITEPTCSTDGVKAQICTACDSPVNETAIPSEKDKHVYSYEYTVDAAATCISKGTESRHCLYCDSKIDEREIPVNSKAHSYNADEWVVTQKPTCADYGYQHRVCKLCNKDSISMLVPKTDHTYPDKYEVIQESADGTSVQVKYVCKVCGHENITIITLGTNTGDGYIGDVSDPEKKIYKIVPKDGLVIRVDYQKMIIYNIARNLTVGDVLAKFKNGSAFIIYNEKSQLINEENNIGTGCRFNYETPDGQVTNYYISVTGDIDSNGKITAADARLILRTAAKITALSEPYLTAADVNLDGKITASDARYTLRVAANMEYFKETYEY